VVAALRDLVAALGPERPVAVARELTKLFEEVFRGTAAAALAHFEQHSPRGEFTLVIGGRSAPIPGGST
jgi:16S rRNA (cytidine1402-2'-O)-methyltransferase